MMKNNSYFNVSVKPGLAETLKIAIVFHQLVQAKNINFNP